MNEKKESIEDIRKKFEQLYWHDSRIINLRLIKYEVDRKYNLELDINLYEETAKGKIEHKRKIIIFRNCRIIKLDFDLLGLLFCNGDISNATCYTNATQIEEERRGKLQHFDFPNTFNPLEKCLVFSIEMIHPAGEILIFARTFEIRNL